MEISQQVYEGLWHETLRWLDVLWNGLLWPLIDKIIFIELNNPTDKVVIFGILVTTILAAILLAPRIIQRYLSNR